MALIQMQIIQSLGVGVGVAWFERELQRRGPPTELRHPYRWIRELNAELISNGLMMVLAVNPQA